MRRRALFFLVTFLAYYKSEYVYKVSQIKSLTSSMGRYFSQDDLEYKVRNINPEVFLERSEFTQFPTATGGLLGKIRIFYISLSEILAVYKCPRGCVGASGRHFMNVSVTILEGEATISDESAPEIVKTLSEGDNIVLRSANKYHVSMEPQTRALIYARGFVPFSLGYAVSDLLFSHFDLMLATTTFTSYFILLFQNFHLLQSLQSLLVFAVERTQSNFEMICDWLARTSPYIYEWTEWLIHLVIECCQTAWQYLQDKLKSLLS